MKTIEVITNQEISYKRDIDVGTKMTINGIIEDRETHSGIAFKIFKCNNYPELEGKTVCSSLISNSQEIIEYFKNDSFESNIKLLLIL
jgi:hypothetical protein